MATAMTTGHAVEVEVAGGRNGSLFFPPLQRVLRGRFDFGRLAAALPDAAALAARWPEAIPGQRVGTDPETGVGYVSDPLASDPRFAALRELIARDGYRLGPEREEFPGVHAPTWLFWMRRAVEGGAARVVAGTLPDKTDGRPRTRFVTQEPEDPRDSTVNRLVAILLASLPADKRRAADELLAGLDGDAGRGA